MKHGRNVGTQLSTEQVSNLVHKMPKIKTKNIITETFGKDGTNSIVESVKKSFEEDEKSFLSEKKLLKDKS